MNHKVPSSTQGMKMTDCKGMGEVILSRLSLPPQGKFLYDLDHDIRYSYEETGRKISFLVAYLESHGIKRNDSIATNLENCSDLVFLILASLVMSTRLALIEPQTPGNLLTEYIDLVKPNILFIKGETDLDFVGVPVLSSIPWDTGKAEDSHRLSNDQTFLQHEDEAFVIFSSGTTGDPKGVIHTHSNILHELEAMINAYKFVEKMKHLSILPFTHASGLYRSLLMPFCSGGTVFMRRAFDPQTFWKDIIDKKIEFVQLVPSHIALLNRFPQEVFPYRLKSLQYVGSASARLQPSEQKRFEEHFKVPILQGYGLTEATCGITLNSHHSSVRRPGVVGLPLGVNEIKIVDNAGIEMEVGEVGEIWVRGKNVTSKWLGETGPSFHEDWLRTGDMGRIEDDGNLTVIGRKTNVVNRGAYKIYTIEVENGLLSLPQVDEAAVIGIPHPILGEDLVAFVTPANIESPLQLLGALRKKISSYKVPTRIIPLNEIPKNRMGKVLQENLLQLLHTEEKNNVLLWDQEDITSMIRTIVADIFSLDPSTITPEYSRDDCWQWDSLGHLQILIAIEQTFGLNLSMDMEGAIATRSVSDLSDLVHYLLVGSGRVTDLPKRGL